MKSCITFLLLSVTVAFAPVTIQTSPGNNGKLLFYIPKATVSSQDFRVVTTIPETEPPAPHTFAGQVERVLSTQGDHVRGKFMRMWTRYFGGPK